MPVFKKAMSGKKNLYIIPIVSRFFNQFQMCIYVYKTIYEGNLVDEYAKCA